MDFVWLVSSEQTLNFVDHNKLKGLNYNIAQEHGTKKGVNSKNVIERKSQKLSRNHLLGLPKSKTKRLVLIHKKKKRKKKKISTYLIE